MKGRPPQAWQPAESNEDTNQAQIEQSFGQLPLLFVENQGQWDEQVAYAVQGSDKTLYFTAEGVTFALTAPTAEEDENDGREEIGPRSKPVRTERWAVKLDFLGANADVEPVGQERDSAVISYFKASPTNGTLACLPIGGWFIPTSGRALTWCMRGR
jgi:hypothetical protein